MAIITKLRISSAANRNNNKNNKTEEKDCFDSLAAARVLMSLKMSVPKSDLKEEQRKLELHKLIGKNKLFLVLDLDHTLLHTISINQLSVTDKDMSFNGNLFRSADDRVTKLRPFVRNFLKEASKLFDLCVYTMGNRPYAENMVSILDPHNNYFNSRVISREDNTWRGRKCLDKVMVPESAVVIVDDTESVWDKDKANLIVVEGYHYFSASKKRRLSTTLFSERLKDESEETDDELVLVLNILKSVHQMFFDDPNMKKDVRNVLKAFWQGGDGGNSMDCS